MKNLNRNSRIFILVVTVGIFVLLIVGFNSRINTLRMLTDEAEEVKAQVTLLEATVVALDTQIAYATSPAAVEEWAYEDARMVREGENLIGPISSHESAPEQPVQVETQLEKLENWEVWLALFFD
jgi:cell division protein FtsB